MSWQKHDLEVGFAQETLPNCSHPRWPHRLMFIHTQGRGNLQPEALGSFSWRRPWNTRDSQGRQTGTEPPQDSNPYFQLQAHFCSYSESRHQNSAWHQTAQCHFRKWTQSVPRATVPGTPGPPPPGGSECARIHVSRNRKQTPTCLSYQVKVMPLA